MADDNTTPLNSSQSLDEGSGRLPRPRYDDRLLFEITHKIRNSSDVRTILATTATELGRVFHARRAHIEINVADLPPLPEVGQE